MIKILTIIGARPQFIKAAVLSREIQNREGVEEVIIHTGQHFDSNMSEIFFEQMNIPKPNYNLEINSMGHGAMTGHMLIKIEEVLLKENPDWVVIYGDTNSTIAGALAASKLQIKVAHVEAGLRSFNMNMPEEINRILTDKISNLLLCPSQNAVQILENEGMAKAHYSQINYVGDIMYDGLLYYKDKIEKPAGQIPENFILATLHRAENTNDLERLNEIVEAMNEIHKSKNIVLPLHPRTKKILDENNIKLHVDILEPVGYHQMLWLLMNSDLVMTDSGGLQKEAYFCDKLCVTLRDETEWIELIENKVNVLAGANKDSIVNSTMKFLEDSDTNFPRNIYGDGTAGKKILDCIVNY